MINLNSTVVQNKKIDATNLNDDKVMMNMERGKYFSLNPVGDRIWDLATEPVKVNFIIEKLIEEYEVERVVCEETVIDFLERMGNEDLIQVK